MKDTYVLIGTKGLWENTEKCITFTFPIEKEVTRIDENGEDITKNIPYILQFIDSTRFMVSVLPSLVKNVNRDMMVKNVKLVELNMCIATVFFNTQILKMI